MKPKIKKTNLTIEFPERIYEELQQLYPQLGMRSLSEFFVHSALENLVRYRENIEAINLEFEKEEKNNYIG